MQSGERPTEIKVAYSNILRSKVSPALYQSNIIQHIVRIAAS
jgi:hypothetical protein